MLIFQMWDAILQESNSAEQSLFLLLIYNSLCTVLRDADNKHNVIYMKVSLDHQFLVWRPEAGLIFQTSAL